jgi:hypothetical protein
VSRKVESIFGTEDEEQATVIEYCDIRDIPIVHIPNEGKRSEAYGSRMKRLGMRKGFPDLFVPLPRHGYHGFFIEMKSEKGKLSPDQRLWLVRLKNAHYATAVCYGSADAIRLIEKYVEE